MAFEKTVTISGDKTYELHEGVKPYALRDLGFIPNNAKAFVLHRSLEANKSYDDSIKLKMTVSPTLDGFKMSVVSAGDQAKFDIFSNESYENQRELFHYYVDELVNREILKVV